MTAEYDLMSRPAVIDEFEQFVQFATRCINEGRAAVSVEELVKLWRSDAESVAVATDVHESLMDGQHDRRESANDAFDDLSRGRGMPTC
jgi:hypothetical protein